jgi:hypothetical protein
MTLSQRMSQGQEEKKKKKKKGTKTIENAAVSADQAATRVDACATATKFRHLHEPAAALCAGSTGLVTNF